LNLPIRRWIQEGYLLVYSLSFLYINVQTEEKEDGVANILICGASIIQSQGGGGIDANVCEPHIRSF
jgi:hypothetical protein